MASSSSNEFEEMMDERFDQIFDQKFENLFNHNEDHQQASHQKKRDEPTLKDNENKDTCSYGTIISVKMQHILLTCFDAVFE
ncbi:hypothetical protein Bca4012_033951 [Brassica carinata]